MPLTVTHAKSDTIADFTGTITGFNSAGNSTTIVATDLVRPSDWNSAHQVTLNLTGSEIASLFNFGSGLTSSTDASGVSVGVRGVNFFEPFALPNTNSTLSTPSVGSWYVDPFVLPFRLDDGEIDIFVTMPSGAFANGAVFSSASTGSMSKIATLSNNLALYMRGTGVSSTRLESLWSGVCEMRATQSLQCNSTTAGGGTTTGVRISNALTVSFPVSVDSTGGMSYSSTSQSGSTSTSVSTGASTLANNLITGAAAYLTGSMMHVVGFNTTITPGIYWMAHMFSSASSSSGATYTAGTMFTTPTRLGLLENSLGGFKGIGASVSATSTTPLPFKGALNTTTSAPTSAMANADIRYTTGRMYWNYDGGTYP